MVNFTHNVACQEIVFPLHIRRNVDFIISIVLNSHDLWPTYSRIHVCSTTCFAIIWQQMYDLLLKQPPISFNIPPGIKSQKVSFFRAAGLHIVDLWGTYSSYTDVKRLVPPTSLVRPLYTVTPAPASKIWKDWVNIWRNRLYQNLHVDTLIQDSSSFD